MNRIIDVNLNRFSEGLRVIEEICRFYLEDKNTLMLIRNLKSRLWEKLAPIRKDVIWFRKSEKDLGRQDRFDKTQRTSIYDVVSANIKRCQESARVLEEIFKIRNQKISRFFKQTRFVLYDLEKNLNQHFIVEFDPKLYVIIDTETTGRKYLSKITKALVLGKATMLQLRESKDTPTKIWLQDARTIKDNINKPWVKFIINDRIDIAQAVDADGVHLGADDMPIKQARGILPINKIIGMTVRNVQDAQKAERDGVNYLSAGSIFASRTKPSAPVIGLKRLKAITKSVKTPVIAIGGITPENTKKIFRVGAKGIAVVSSVFNGVDFNAHNFENAIKINLKRLLKEINYNF
ncbi:MAG: thiamine phosphate synthase [candidate division WOR-3 bacterium]|nr:thiamine phosphate synthase [candidate division WOR-3 bacterium]